MPQDGTWRTITVYGCTVCQRDHGVGMGDSIRRNDKCTVHQTCRKQELPLSAKLKDIYPIELRMRRGGDVMDKGPASRHGDRSSYAAQSKDLSLQVSKDAKSLEPGESEPFPTRQGFQLVEVPGHDLCQDAKPSRYKIESSSTSTRVRVIDLEIRSHITFCISRRWIESMFIITREDQLVYLLYSRQHQRLPAGVNPTNRLRSSEYDVVQILVVHAISKTALFIDCRIYRSFFPCASCSFATTYPTARARPSSTGTMGVYPSRRFAFSGE